ncbi:iron chaperone [Alloscardovia venturai]|uniref:Iron chaperone n=1 Tax=Alloscardovia venturai TaxID=1769421 RepID=A0ABW2Y5P1_9BIFI
MTIDEYFLAIDDDNHRKQLVVLWRAVLSALNVEKVDSLSLRFAWGMPSVYYGSTPVVHMAAMKKHIGIYPGSQAIEEFSHRLSQYKTTKGAIQIPYGVDDTDILVKRVTDIALWLWAKNNRSEVHTVRRGKGKSE